MDNHDVNYREYLSVVANNDVARLLEKDKAYGASWKRRGGTGAFMMLARKWDRLEVQISSEEYGYNIFSAILGTLKEPESVLDTLDDLARYALLVRAEIAYELDKTRMAKKT